MKNESQIKKESSFRKFINYISKTSSGMAIGLFGTLIVGVIIEQIAKVFNFEKTKAVYDALIIMAGVFKSLVGAGIGLGIAITLKLPIMLAVTSMVCGYLGGHIFLYNEAFFTKSTDELFTLVNRSDPLCSYIACLLAINAHKLIFRNKKTPLDLLLIPLLGFLTTAIFIFSCSFIFNYLTVGLGKIIEMSTSFAPYTMALVISVLMGMALTSPISSVAVGVMINIGNTKIASAAALIGCSTQMIGFAIHAARDNKLGSVISIFIGTSMLEFKNIVKKPIIWLPTIICSALLSPLAVSTTLNGFQIYTNSVGAGMGTSGLVGFITGIGEMSSTYGLDLSVLSLLLFTIIIPIIFMIAFDELFRYFNILKINDFSLKENKNQNLNVLKSYLKSKKYII